MPGEPPPQLRAVERRSQPEPPRGLLLEPVEQIDRLPQRARGVAKVVVRDTRARARRARRRRPSARVRGRLPSTGARGRRPSACQLEQRDHRALHRAVDGVDREEHLALAELACSPQCGRPEVGGEIRRTRRRPGGAPGASPSASSSGSCAVATTRSFGVFTLRSSASSTSSTVGLTPRSESSPRGDARLELGEHRLRVRRPGAGPSAGPPAALDERRAAAPA